MEYDAIILAGGESTSELRKIAPYANEALIIIGSYPMVYYVYKALRQSWRINRVVISGPVDALRSLFPLEERLFFVEGGENAVESFKNAVDFLQQDQISSKILIMPTDIPFITTEAIDDFITQTEATEADFYYPVTERKVNEAKFPHVARTYVNLQEGVFTGGNLFIIKTEIIDRILDIALQLVVRRKNPLAIARLFGIGLVLRYLWHRLSISAAEKRFKEVTGIRGKAIISPYAEVGVDVDKPSDLKLAQEYLQKTSFEA